MWGWLDRLVEPTVAIVDIGERRRARLLASMVLILVPFGFVTVFMQLLTRPNFARTFVSNSIALLVLAVCGWLARTRHYRRAAGAAVVVVVLACAVAGLNDPCVVRGSWRCWHWRPPSWSSSSTASSSRAWWHPSCSTSWFRPCYW